MEQLESWLKTQDVRMSRAIAARAALRSLPALMEIVEQNFESSGISDLFLVYCRAALLTGVASTCPPLFLEKMSFASLAVSDARSVGSVARSIGSMSAQSAAGYALSAAQSALSTTRSVSSDSARSATRSATSSAAAFSTVSDARFAVFSDATAGKTKSHVALFSASLWPATDHIEHLLSFWRSFSNRPDPDKTWTFWKEWYQGMLDGKPLDWDLQLQVALIEDGVWKEGPEAVAKEIERIKAAHLAKKLPLAETIELNPDTGRFHTSPVPVQNAPLMAALLTRISDDLEDAMTGHNGLTERSGDVRKISRVVTRYGNDPQQAELTLTTVAKSLRRQIHDSHELPESSDNLALLDSVQEGVRGIRANHPDVAANREQLAQQALLGLEPEEKQTLEQALPVLIAISEGALSEDFAEDIPELINDAQLPLPDDAPALPAADAATRVFSRISTMALLVQKMDTLTERGSKAFDSNLVKTVRLAGLTFSFAGGAGWFFLYAIVQIGLHIFGAL